MKRGVLWIAFALSVVAAIRAQDARPPEQRWSELDKEQRQALLQRFEKLKSMPEAQRAELEKRHRALQEQERRLLDGMSPDERRQLAAASPEERRRTIAKLIEQRRAEVLRGAGRDPDARPFGALASQARARVERQLRIFVKDGLIEPEEVERLLGEPPGRIAPVVRELRKKAFLLHPPPFFRKLQASEQQRLIDARPEEFAQEVRRLKQSVKPPNAERRPSLPPQDPNGRRRGL